MRLDPSLPGVRFNYALVLARAGDYSESEKLADLELRSNVPKPESPLDLWQLKAHDLQGERNWQGMIEAYRKVLQLKPECAEAYAAVGEALYRTNRPEESRANLIKAIALDDHDASSRVYLGKLYQEAGKLDEALALFEAADQLRPGDRDVTYRLFRIYRSRGDKENASRMQTKLETLIASSLSKSNGEAEAARLNQAGIASEVSGQFKQALEFYDQAAKADVEGVISRRNAALLLCKTGKAQEAIPRLREILLLDPDDAVTARILQVAEEIVSGDGRSQRSLPPAQSSDF